jgi:short-subunit dehydrogenase
VSLKRARVLLTGASGGLGQALAESLASAGASLLLAGTRLDVLTDLRDRLPGEHSLVAANLTQAEGLAAVCDAAHLFGPTILINNAGASHFGLYDEMDPEDLDRVLQTNLLAPMRLTRAVLPSLRARADSAIVNIGSVFGNLPFPGFVAYSSAKAGLRGFSQALRRELAGSGPLVLYIAPRAIDTAFNSPAVQALNRAMGSRADPPAVVATQVLCALQARRPETCLGFPERLFTWLNGLAPRVIDRALADKLPLIEQHTHHP